VTRRSSARSAYRPGGCQMRRNVDGRLAMSRI
jgi:hypothetical protein